MLSGTPTRNIQRSFTTMIVYQILCITCYVIEVLFVFKCKCSDVNIVHYLHSLFRFEQVGGWIQYRLYSTKLILFHSHGND